MSATVFSRAFRGASFILAPRWFGEKRELDAYVRNPPTKAALTWISGRKFEVNFGYAPVGRHSRQRLVVQILRLVPAFRRSDSRSQRRAEVAVVQKSREMHNRKGRSQLESSILVHGQWRCRIHQPGSRTAISHPTVNDTQASEGKCVDNVLKDQLSSAPFNSGATGSPQSKADLS
jgi:hypothetical protein